MFDGETKEEKTSFCSDVSAFTSFQLDTVKPDNSQKKTTKPNKTPQKL